MKRSDIYNLQFKRKRNGLTDYRKRLKILSSRKPRLVVRKSVKNIFASIIVYKDEGDLSKASAHSRMLKKLGWEFNTGSLPSAYLVGFLLGKKAIKAGIKEAVMDIGLQKSIKGSRIYAVLAGAVDAGLSVPHKKEMLPGKDRLGGKHIADYAGKLKGNDEAMKKQFGNYIKENKDLSSITKNIEDVKKNIETNLSK